MSTDLSISDYKAAVIEVAASVFEMRPEQLGVDASPETVDNWDSLNHLKLITAVESAFEIRLPMTVVLEIDSMGALIAAVENCRQ